MKEAELEQLFFIDWSMEDADKRKLPKQIKKWKGLTLTFEACCVDPDCVNTAHALYTISEETTLTEFVHAVQTTIEASGEDRHTFIEEFAVNGDKLMILTGS